MTGMLNVDCLLLLLLTGLILFFYFDLQNLFLPMPRSNNTILNWRLGPNNISTLLLVCLC